MDDVTFEVQVSSDILKFGLNQEQIQRNVKEWLVLSLFTDSHISSGKAAKLLDISRIDFLTVLRKRGIACAVATPHKSLTVGTPTNSEEMIR